MSCLIFLRPLFPPGTQRKGKEGAVASLSGAQVAAFHPCQVAAASLIWNTRNLPPLLPPPPQPPAIDPGMRSFARDMGKSDAHGPCPHFPLAPLGEFLLRFPLSNPIFGKGPLGSPWVSARGCVVAPGAQGDRVPPENNILTTMHPCLYLGMHVYMQICGVNVSVFAVG